MNQIKNSFNSIEQMRSQLLLQKSGKNPAAETTGRSFEQILGEKGKETTALRFSKHANERLASRSIDLSSEQVKRLEAGALRASEKGIVESLVMVDSYAFIVNTRSNIVVTAVAGNEDKIFTNIDGAVIS